MKSKVPLFCCTRARSQLQLSCRSAKPKCLIFPALTEVTVFSVLGQNTLTSIPTEPLYTEEYNSLGAIGYTIIIDIIPIQWTSHYSGYHSASRSQMTSADCHFEPEVVGPYPASDVTVGRYWCLHQVSDWELSS